MRLIAAALVILAGTLTYALGEVSAAISASSQSGRLESAVAVRDSGRTLGYLGVLLFVVEYVRCLMRRDAGPGPPNAAGPAAAPDRGG